MLVSGSPYFVLVSTGPKRGLVPDWDARSTPSVPDRLTDAEITQKPQELGLRHRGWVCIHARRSQGYGPKRFDIRHRGTPRCKYPCTRMSWRHRPSRFCRKVSAQGFLGYAGKSRRKAFLISPQSLATESRCKAFSVRGTAGRALWTEAQPNWSAPWRNSEFIACSLPSVIDRDLRIGLSRLFAVVGIGDVPECDEKQGVLSRG